MGVHDGNAMESLEQIRAGGGNLVLVAHLRLSETKKALDHGHFHEAYAAASSLVEKLSHLASAELRLGALSGATLIRAEDVEVGMEVPDAGPIVSIEPCEYCEREHCENVTFKFENGQALTVEREEEMIVAQQHG